MDKLHFDRTDYSVVVKNRAPPPSSWKWEIYRAGRSSPIKQSSVYFHTMVTANRAGKEALVGAISLSSMRMRAMRSGHHRLDDEHSRRDRGGVAELHGRASQQDAHKNRGPC